MPGVNRLAFLKNVVTNPQIVVGDYTYYDDPDGPERFQEENVLYLFEFLGDKLIIGRYCAIAAKATFLMNGGLHPMTGFSTYPFYALSEDWQAATPEDQSQAWRGDTNIGHDVWIGYAATFMPGVTVGNGAIIGAQSVVTKDVPPYTVVAGNPARVLYQRFPDAVVAALQDIAWWHWDAAKVTRHVAAIVGGDIEALRRAE